MRAGADTAKADSLVQAEAQSQALAQAQRQAQRLNSQGPRHIEMGLSARTVFAVLSEGA